MSRLTRDGTAEPVSRDQILRHARGQGNIHFPCSADHEQDWQPYPVDPCSAICDGHTYILLHTYIHTLIYFYVLRTYYMVVIFLYCVCVCVFSSHSFWTSMDVPAGVTQEEGNTGFSIHLLSAVLA